MKYAILALFFAVNAKAGITPASQPSSGGSDCTANCTFTGTTTNALVVASSITVDVNLIKTVNGKVGIGQVSPTALLHINTGNGDGTSATGIQFGSDATAVLTRDNAYGGSMFLGSLRTTGAQNFFGGGQGAGTIDLYALGNGFARDGGTGDFYLRVNSLNSLTLVPGTGGTKLYSRTKAQIIAIDPSYVGEMFYCSDCSDPTSGKATVVIATGTAVGQFGTLPVGAFQ